MARENFTDEQAYENRFENGAVYATVNMQDLINNFIFAYTGEGKLLRNVTRQEVAFWAQRSVQEFAYDITRSQRVMEVDYNPDTLSFVLPPDFVNLQKITLATNNGEEFILQRVQDKSFSAKTQLLDQNYEPLFDDNGEAIDTGFSETVEYFQHPQNVYERELVQDLYWSDYYYDNDYEYGRRYGIDPARANLNPKYFVSFENATVYFNDAITRFITGTPIPKMYYISDGLKDSEDFTKVLIPKLAEDAVYENILFNIARLRPDTATIAAPYQKSAMAKKRNAKLRIQNYQNIDWQQLMKQKSKWIKY